MRGFIGAAALAAGLAMPAGALAGGPNFTVNDNASGAGPAGADCANASFTSIQAAVDAASNGQQILVCAGQYPESVTVNKVVQLRGAQAGFDGRNRSGASQESVILGDGSTNGGVSLTESGITVDGFVVTNAADPGIGAGIAMSASEGNQTIINNVLTDNTIGVSANNADGAPSLIQKNQFADNNVPGPAAGNAIYADSNADDLTIDQNSFKNQVNASIQLNGSGPNPSNDNVSITQNTFSGTNANPGRNELRVLMLYTSNSDITENTFTNMNNNAVHLAGANDSITVSDNDITGSGFAGVRVADFGVGSNSNISVLGNTLVGNDAGINAGSNGIPFNGTMTATGNRIVGNNTGIINNSPGFIAADNNWWGCNTGPNTPGCDTTTVAAIDSNEFLTLAIDAPAKIKQGKSKPITASLVGSGPCLFPDGTPIAFSTTKGTLSGATALTQNCQATVTLKGARRGTATVSATLDGETVSDTVTFVRKKN